ncbi:MAG: formylglycine-generating enzyme family protein [Gammaproteobacteria bacterium]|nr:formylglycine-generating enzyme family protein [Gammaproteobacteria bacterium]
MEQGGYRDRKASWWTDAGCKMVLEGEGRSAPNGWDEPDLTLDNHPVTGVTWFEAVAYCRWLTKRYREAGLLPEGQVVRLPTEAEWEWAARGPEGLRWPWDNVWPHEGGVLCNSEEAGIGLTSAVGLFPAARTGVVGPAGKLVIPGEPVDTLFDQAGNVWEWCSTQWREKYPLPLVDEWSENYLRGESGRVLRGGSFYVDCSRCRGACRLWDYPWLWLGYRGFRCCVAMSSSDS